MLRDFKSKKENNYKNPCGTYIILLEARGIDAEIPIIKNLKIA